jgi:hypothetical protein
MVMTRESTTGLAPPGEDQRREVRERSSSATQAVLTRPVHAEASVVQAISVGTDDPRRAAERLFVAAEGSRDRLSRARSVLSERLHLRSDDFEATLALRIVERALAQTPYPDGPWRWQRELSRRRIRAANRRRAKATRRAERARPSSATGEPAKLHLGAEEVLCTPEAPAASCTHTWAVATPGV